MNDTLLLRGRRILVTGAGGGIGLATSEILRQLGARLLLTDIRSNDGIDEMLSRGGDEVSFLKVDLTDEQAIADLELGHLDAVVVLNGIFPTADWLSDETWQQTFRTVMDVNLLGSLTVLRKVLPGMTERGAGQIVLVGSTAGRTGGNPEYVQPHYAASKAGLHVIVYNLAKRFARNGLRINGVAPGAVDTTMNAGLPRSDASLPLGRMGTAEEIAWPIAFLCSPRASYLSGTIIDANGGMYMH
jgi:3-oxoacyl-[acyl-carrier protein] reductase